VVAVLVVAVAVAVVVLVVAVAVAQHLDHYQEEQFQSLPYFV
jgi:hypothetical protein